MRRACLIVFSTLLLLVGCFSQGDAATQGLIRGVVTKAQNGEPGVLPAAHTVLRGPATRETASDAREAFAIDGLLPRTYQIEANASRLYVALTVEVSTDTSPTVPAEMNVSAVTSTPSPELTALKAMNCAFSRKVHHA